MLYLAALFINVLLVSGLEAQTCNINGVEYEEGERYPESGCRMVMCGNKADVLYGCTSQNDPSKCVEANGVEELDCVTYSCVYDQDVGHGVLKEDEEQIKRCSINGACYEAGEGPNLCTRCGSNPDGTVSVEAGCALDGGSCAAEGSEVQDGCDIKICTIRNNVVDFHKVATVGCLDRNMCYGEGARTFDLTCNKCVKDPATGFHYWYRECRDRRNEQCYKEHEYNDLNCATLVCHNRGGIGWSFKDVRKCRVSASDCVPYNSTSVRNGFCYHCKDEAGGPPEVACKACGKCVLPGESAECDGTMHVCDTIPTVPPMGQIKCNVNNVLMDEGTVEEVSCNRFECTRFGIVQLDRKCRYKGKCYQLDKVINSTNCLMCSEDGIAGSKLTGGCKHQGKCYKEGVTIKINCLTMVCTNRENVFSFVPLPEQQTPCMSHGSCYPVGPFEYAGGRICAKCKADGSIEYACKLSNGECLAIDAEESIASEGCYRMKCTYSSATRTLTVSRAPGQARRCYMVDGTCLDDNEEKTIDGKTYICAKEGQCTIGDEKIKTGESMTYFCHEMECQQTTEPDGTKKIEAVVRKYGCPFGDSCKPLNATFEINCDIYECKHPPGDVFAKSTKTRDRCSIDGHCLEVGDENTNDNCVTHKCEASGKVVVKQVGCRSKLMGTCLSPGQTVTVEGKTEKCSDSGALVTSGGNDGHQTPCKINGMEVPYGQTMDLYCNTYKCEHKNNVTLAWLQGKPQCQVTTSSGVECFDAGTTKYCIACGYDTNVFPPQITIDQTCIGDGGECVPLGKEVKYRCGLARCNPDTKAMDVLEKTQCAYKGQCVPTDSYVSTIVEGATHECTCLDPRSNSISCLA